MICGDDDDGLAEECRRQQLLTVKYSDIVLRMIYFLLPPNCMAFASRLTMLGKAYDCYLQKW